jgi:hypothetical protein
VRGSPSGPACHLLKSFPVLGKGLAAHLDVPLPYLLYRVNARFQEEIRGLKDISGALSPALATQNVNKTELPEKPSVPGRISTRMGGSIGMGANGLPSPIGVRARLNSLGNNTIRQKKNTSSSTITVQAPKKLSIPEPISPSSSEVADTDSEDEQARKEEEADRMAEEQEALDRKLRELQQMMTNDALGLVSSRGTERGRRRKTPPSPASLSTGGYSRRRDDTLSSRSLSSTGSPHGSMPDIPSPSTNGSQSNSPMSRHMSSAKSSSSASVSPSLATGRRYAPLSLSEQESSHGSETSSFSDISGMSSSMFSSTAETATFDRKHISLGIGKCLDVQFTRSRVPSVSQLAFQS